MVGNKKASGFPVTTIVLAGLISLDKRKSFHYYSIPRIDYSKKIENMQVKVKRDEEKKIFWEEILVGAADAFADGSDFWVFGKDGGGVVKKQQCDCGSADG